MDLVTASIVVATLFAAAFVHSAIGFGIGLVSMPILATVLDVRTAAPIVALMGLSINGALISRLWRSVDFRASSRLLVGAAVGMPLGAAILRVAPEDAVRVVLGVLLMALGLSHFVSARLPTLERKAWGYLFGFLSGLLGGAYTLIGPPIVMYGAMRRWPPERFRATLQGYFFPASALMCLTHLVSGLWTTRVVGLYAVGLVPVVGGLTLGHALATRMPAGRFQHVLYIALVAFGVMLVG